MTKHILDAAFVTGACAVAYGAWAIYAPAGYIVGGAMLMGVSFLAAVKRGTDGAA